MPMVALALILAVVISTVVLVGLLWALIVLIPYYAYVGVALYLLWRASQKHKEAGEALRREAERRRSFNDQEMRAWQAVIEQDQRSQAKRERALRQFDRSRDDPPSST